MISAILENVCIIREILETDRTISSILEIFAQSVRSWRLIARSPRFWKPIPHLMRYLSLIEQSLRSQKTDCADQSDFINWLRDQHILGDWAQDHCDLGDFWSRNKSDFEDISALFADLPVTVYSLTILTHPLFQSQSIIKLLWKTCLYTATSNCNWSFFLKDIWFKIFLRYHLLNFDKQL